MKFFFIFALLLSSVAHAENCTSVIKETQSNIELEILTRTSYSNQAACDLAMYDCKVILAKAKSEGKYLGAECSLKNTTSTNVVVCVTDMYDFFGRFIRTFAAPGQNSMDACNYSFNFCQFEAMRVPNYGLRCVIRGILDTGSHQPNPVPSPTPTPSRSAECNVNRLDGKGVFLQNYLGRAIGPVSVDVRELACRQALDSCSLELKENQTCEIVKN